MVTVEYNNELATIKLGRSLANRLSWIFCTRIRQIAVPVGSELNQNEYMVDQVNFKEIHTLSRMCYEIAEQEFNSRNIEINISNLSRDDVDILYNIRFASMGSGTSEDKELTGFHNLLNEIRLKVRYSGPVDMLEADKIAKDFITVIES